jgi:hypothetical protein
MSNTVDILNSKITLDENRNAELDLKIDNEELNIYNIKCAQRIRKQKIVRIKSQILDLREQVELLKDITKTDNIELKMSIKKYNCHIKTHHIISTRIYKNKYSRDWKILLNESKDLIMENKLKTNLIDQKPTQTRLHNQIRKLPDELIRYIYDYLTYDIKIGLFEYKYKLYKMLSLHSNVKFRMLMSRIIYKLYCSNCIDCPNLCKVCPGCMTNPDSDCYTRKCRLCKNCNDCLHSRQSIFHYNIWNRSISDISYVFKGFILKNKIHKPKIIFNLIRKSILLSIVQTKFDNK